VRRRTVLRVCRGSCCIDSKKIYIIHTNLVSIQSAEKQDGKNILPMCTRIAALESRLQLEIMHGGKFSD
jgi:hypothetical protein